VDSVRLDMRSEKRKDVAMAQQYVRLACVSCGKRLRARVSLVGRKVKCPACGMRGRVPGRMSSESSASFPQPVFRKREDNGLYQRWKLRAAPISHPDYLFLAPGFSPDSCVPCRGFTEWIAEAWRAGDLKSIARLIRRIIAAGDLSREARDRLIILPYDMAGIDTSGTVVGLSGRQASFLVSAYILQEVVSGREGNDAAISTGVSELLAASVLPLRFDIADLDDLVDRANRVLTDLRSKASAKGMPTVFRQEEFTQDTDEMRADLLPILKRMGSLTTSARMHLLDALRSFKKGYSQEPLEGCASNRTRQFGCRVDKTSCELMEGGYFTDTPPAELLESLFKKKDLQAVLTEAAIVFKKSARKADLWSLATKHASSLLESRAQSMGVIALSEEMCQNRDALLEYVKRQSRLLAAWAIGAVLPQLRALQKPVESEHSATATV